MERLYFTFFPPDVYYIATFTSMNEFDITGNEA
jgi:hypothetical protein